MDLDTILVLQNAGVDTEGTLRRFIGNSGLYERFLAKFLSDPTFQGVTNAFEAEGTQATPTSTHTFKRLTASPGLTRLYGISPEMMDYIRGDKSAETSGKYGGLRKAYDGICKILSKAWVLYKNLIWIYQSPESTDPDESQRGKVKCTSGIRC